MRKSAKLILFVVGATFFNIAITALVFIGLLEIYSLVLSRFFSQSAVMWAVVVCFIISLVISMLVYKKLLSWARVKFNLDERLGLILKKP